MEDIFNDNKTYHLRGLYPYMGDVIKEYKNGMHYLTFGLFYNVPFVYRFFNNLGFEEVQFKIDKNNRMVIRSKKKKDILYVIDNYGLEIFIVKDIELNKKLILFEMEFYRRPTVFTKRIDEILESKNISLNDVMIVNGSKFFLRNHEIKQEGYDFRKLKFVETSFSTKIITQIGDGYVSDNQCIVIEHGYYELHLVKFFPYYFNKIADSENAIIDASGYFKIKDLNPEDWNFSSKENWVLFYFDSSNNNTIPKKYKNIFFKNSEEIDKILKKLFVLKLENYNLYSHIINNVNFRKDQNLFEHADSEKVIDYKLKDDMYIYYYTDIERYLNVLSDFEITHSTEIEPEQILSNGLVTPIIFHGNVENFYSEPLYVYTFLKKKNYKKYFSPKFNYIFDKKVLGFLPFISLFYRHFSNHDFTFNYFSYCFDQLRENDWFELRFNLVIPPEFIKSYNEVKIDYEISSPRGVFPKETFIGTHFDGRNYHTIILIQNSDFQEKYDFLGMFVPYKNLGYFRFPTSTCDHSIIEFKSKKQENIMKMINEMKLDEYMNDPDDSKEDLRENEISYETVPIKFETRIPIYFDDEPCKLFWPNYTNVETFFNVGNGYLLHNFYYKIELLDYVVYMMILFPFYRNKLNRKYETPDGIIFRGGYIKYGNSIIFYHHKDINSKKFFKKLSFDGILKHNSPENDEKLKKLFSLRLENSSLYNEIIHFDMKREIRPRFFSVSEDNFYRASNIFVYLEYEDEYELYTNVSPNTMTNANRKMYSDLAEAYSPLFLVPIESKHNFSIKVDKKILSFLPFLSYNELETCIVYDKNIDGGMIEESLKTGIPIIMLILNIILKKFILV